MKKYKGKLKLFSAIVLMIMFFSFIASFAFSSNVAYAAIPQQDEGNWGLFDAKVIEAQQITKGRSSVLVGVIDCGIETRQSYISSAVNASLSRDFTNGSTSGEPSQQTTDNVGHGTHVAGIIAAQLDSIQINGNSITVGGVAPNVELVSLKISNTYRFDNDYIVNAINYATSSLLDENDDNDISILNYSGGSSFKPYEQSIDDLFNAIEAYCNAGGLMIVAAGNYKLDLDDEESKFYPASFDLNEGHGNALNLDNLITVGALESVQQTSVRAWGHGSDTETSGSNYGCESVDLFAPGKDIYSTYPLHLCRTGTCDLATHRANGYHCMTGTSMAAPFVTGVAALLKSINPALTGIQIKEIILHTVDEVNSLSGLSVTGGKLNALRAVNSIAYDYDAATSTITGLNFVPNGELTLPTTLRINNNDEEIENIGYNTFQNCAELTEITIPSGVKTIGNFAFANCEKLSRVVFSEGSQLTSIGDNAFENCTSLTDLILPESITSIGNNAFENCTSLTEIVLPGIDSIGNSLFRGCSSLTSISMPYRVASIGNFAFAGCEKLSRVVFPEGSQLTSIGDYAFQGCIELESVSLINCSLLDYIGIKAFQCCSDLTEIVIPDGVMRIDDSAFQMSGLTKIELSNTSALSSVGNSAFNQTKITYMIIPSGLEEIGMYAFSACDSLTTVYYGGESETDWNNISIGVNNSSLISARKYYYRSGQPTVYGYFWHYVGKVPQVWPFSGLKYTLINNGTEYEISKASNLEGEIEIPSMYNEKPVTRIARWGFANSLDITGIIIPESISMLYGDSFANCPNIESITIKSITVDSANSVYMSSGNCLIARRTQILVLGCKNSVLPQGVQEIGDYAFAGCTNLTSITIPGSVVTIGESAFEDCRGLTSFIMQSGLQTIGNNALKNCSGITNVSIPDSVTSIGDYAFYGLGFTSVTVPSSVSSIGQNAFGGNNLTAINVDTGNTCYYSHGGVLFGAEGVLLSCPSAKSGNYDIPDGTTEIGDYAFYGCWQLTGITIINNVTSIGEYAFWGCTQLAYITISADSVLESIGSSAFFECFGVSEITIPQSVTFIGATAFGDWTEDQTIVMNVDVSFVWQWDVDWALQCYAQINWGGNSAIATEGLQYTLTNVGYEVSVGSSLSDNDNNGTVVIPAVYNGYPVVGVAESGFFGCQGLVKVMFIGNNLMYIGNNAFADCSNLTAINIPHGVTHIGQEAFCSCIQLQSINLPQTIEEIYCTAFKECDNLKSIMIQGGLTYIEVDTFDEINEYTIYTENGSDNPEWHFINFSPSCVVFYNCTFSVDGAFVVSILVQGENYVNANPTAPCREGYVFAGWTTTLGGDVEYDMEDAVSGAISDTVLYAVWEPVGE